MYLIQNKGDIDTKDGKRKSRILIKLEMKLIKEMMRILPTIEVHTKWNGCK